MSWTPPFEIDDYVYWKGRRDLGYLKVKEIYGWQCESKDSVGWVIRVQSSDGDCAIVSADKFEKANIATDDTIIPKGDEKRMLEALLTQSRTY